ncbi:2'-5' RNA ligase family protein [Marinilongibacter aquaticus]|uniref:2'-5' RNA ligase family protein n=1 Tax=Marinilongibacter aquaticus TaxID=2975157 RepID=UPI0021BD90C2|nr:2'-5' RNA ligase family protein [Marinilongibacter aquaticus]UBM60686.1 2'-5' RNA ligase family protein [Marinilongibacter aquaticus]
MNESPQLGLFSPNETVEIEIAFAIPEPLHGQILNLKRQIFAVAGNYDFSRSAPHISVHNFEVGVKSEKIVFSKIQKHLSLIRPINLHLDGFEFIPKQFMAWSKIFNRADFDDVRQAIKHLRLDIDKHNPNFSFHPHLTVARMKSKEQYLQLTEILEKTALSGQYLLDKILVQSPLAERNWEKREIGVIHL